MRNANLLNSKDVAQSAKFPSRPAHMPRGDFIIASTQSDLNDV
jgi:hypothetical protein